MFLWRFTITLTTETKPIKPDGREAGETSEERTARLRAELEACRVERCRMYGVDPYPQPSETRPVKTGNASQDFLTYDAWLQAKYGQPGFLGATMALQMPHDDRNIAAA